MAYLNGIHTYTCMMHVLTIGDELPSRTGENKNKNYEDLAPSLRNTVCKIRAVMDYGSRLHDACS